MSPQTKRIEPFLGDFIPVIMGPTASGKSALALEVALASEGEILSADSMQLYRGLDIGTSKASKTEQEQVPHHLIDVLDIHEKADVFQYCRLAEQAVRDVQLRNKRPVLEGGSGLYLHGFLYGLDNVPADQALRDRLDALYDNGERFPELQEIMKKKAPDDYAKFGEHRRKLIRAYEVFQLSGKQMSDFQRETKHLPPRPGFRQFLLVWERSELRKRIFARTEQMLSSGWIEEAEHMLFLGLRGTPTAWQAIGYAQIGEFLDGKMSRSELAEKIAIATCQYARRQMTWFRNRHPHAVQISMPLI